MSVSVGTQTESVQQRVMICSLVAATGEAAAADAIIMGDDDAASLSFQGVALDKDQAKSIRDRHKTEVDAVERGSAVFYVTPPRFDGSRVRRVLLNLEIPPVELERKDPNDMKWLGLVSGVVGACRVLFPNMEPEQSGFNVHSGCRHYSADKTFYLHGPEISPDLKLK